MQKIITIIGAGQLGSRHLQALKLIKTPLKIHVIDPIQSSLDLAKERYLTINGFDHHEVIYSQSINVQEEIDIAIIATNADVRRVVIQHLIQQCKVHHMIIEKILFNHDEDYEEIEQLLLAHQVKAWVNCPMRIMPSYQNIYDVVQNTKIFYRVSGGAFGLMTNAIHYLDHLCYLTGSDHFKLDITGLKNHLIASKRKNFHEVTGRLLAHFDNGSRCEIIEDLESSAPILIEIFNSQHRYFIRETEHLACYSGELNQWKWNEFKFEIPFQSQMTNEVVQTILEKQECNLTPFKASKKIHMQLLNPIHNAKIFNQEKFLFT